VSDTPLGFIGLGNMGGRIARRLAEKGRSLVVFDTQQAAVDRLVAHGALAASDPAEVASRSEIVFVCLPTPAVVEQVALGEAGIVRGSRVRVHVDLSTTGPVVAQAISSRLAEHNIACVDSPVSGGLAAAETGRLALMVAGALPAVQEVLPILHDLGTPTHVSETVGLGHMMKLINNLLSGTAIAITAEAMVLGVKAGLDPEVMLKVLNLGSGRNCATEERFPNHVLDRSFGNGFAVGLMRKDVRLCLEMAETLQIPLWVGTAVDRLWMQAVVQLGADQATTSIVRIVEQWAGVEVRSKASRQVLQSAPTL
jgi:2-hydroxy-3-oxopropionate reductase